MNADKFKKYGPFRKLDTQWMTVTDGVKYSQYYGLVHSHPCDSNSFESTIILRKNGAVTHKYRAHKTGNSKRPFRIIKASGWRERISQKKTHVKSSDYQNCLSISGRIRITGIDHDATIVGLCHLRPSDVLPFTTQIRPKLREEIDGFYETRKKRKERKERLRKIPSSGGDLPDNDDIPEEELILGGGRKSEPESKKQVKPEIKNFEKSKTPEEEDEEEGEENEDEDEGEEEGEESEDEGEGEENEGEGVEEEEEEGEELEKKEEDVIFIHRDDFSTEILDSELGLSQEEDESIERNEENTKILRYEEAVLLAFCREMRKILRCYLLYIYSKSPKFDDPKRVVRDVLSLKYPLELSINQCHSVEFPRSKAIQCVIDASRSLRISDLKVGCGDRFVKKMKYRGGMDVHISDHGEVEVYVFPEKEREKEEQESREQYCSAHMLEDVSSYLEGTMKAGFKNHQDFMQGEFKKVRNEMKGEFKNVRNEMKGEFKKVRNEMKGEFENVRNEMKGEFKNVRNEMKLVKLGIFLIFVLLIAILLFK